METESTDFTPCMKPCMKKEKERHWMIGYRRERLGKYRHGTKSIYWQTQSSPRRLNQSDLDSMKRPCEKKGRKRKTVIGSDMKAVACRPKGEKKKMPVTLD